MINNALIPISNFDTSGEQEIGYYNISSDNNIVKLYRQCYRYGVLSTDLKVGTLWTGEIDMGNVTRYMFHINSDVVRGDDGDRVSCPEYIPDNFYCNVFVRRNRYIELRLEEFETLQSGQYFFYITVYYTKP